MAFVTSVCRLLPESVIHYGILCAGLVVSLCILIAVVTSKYIETGLTLHRRNQISSTCKIIVVRLPLLVPKLVDGCSFSFSELQCGESWNCVVFRAGNDEIPETVERRLHGRTYIMKSSPFAKRLE